MPLEKKLDKVPQKKNTGDLDSEVNDIVKEVYEKCYFQFISGGINNFIIYREGDHGLRAVSAALRSLDNSCYRGFQIECQLVRESDSSKKVKYGLKFGFDQL